MIRYFKKRVARSIIDMIWREMTELMRKRDGCVTFKPFFQQRINALSDIREKIADEYKINISNERC